MLKRLLLILSFMFLNFVVFSQMKRSSYGTYVGEIESYSIGKSDQLIPISPTKIQIQIIKDQIFIFLGEQKYEGTWKVLLETKVYYLLEAYTESKAPERLMVYKNERKILREGISPQPNVILHKKR